ncbi:hypothetical protein F4806DRAFT_482910 [Annulohypoxylon nitens]|nr:hypothetical protein F4806DRAFT_482910 [Annulohypoxylon nitens]
MSFSKRLISEFCPELEIETRRDGGICLRRRDGNDTLPGQPWVQLDDQTIIYLRKAHLVPELDKLSPYLSLISTPSETNIESLHHQEVKSRRIIPSEHPGLHAIWYHDRIYLKPIPVYMFSKAFWEYIENADPDLFKASCGFMRTYCLLIRHELDFRRAVRPDIGLIPHTYLRNSDEVLNYDKFVTFISQLAALSNHQVSPRYSYGTIRLSRLNYMAFLIGKFTYFHIHSQWRDYLTHLLAPIVAAFVVVSVILNAMQVCLTAQGLQQGTAVKALVTVSWWFSIIVLIAIAAGLSMLVVISIVIIVKDQCYARSTLKAKRLGKKVQGHAVV